MRWDVIVSSPLILGILWQPGGLNVFRLAAFRSWSISCGHIGGALGNESASSKISLLSFERDEASRDDGAIRQNGEKYQPSDSNVRRRWNETIASLRCFMVGMRSPKELEKMRPGGNWCVVLLTSHCPCRSVSHSVSHRTDTWGACFHPRS